jgi:formate dehydrogenase subunit gamma
MTAGLGLGRMRRRIGLALIGATLAMALGGVLAGAAEAAVPMQVGSDSWHSFRNGPLPVYGARALGGIVGLLALFFLLRGRIAIEHGWAGRTLTRFGGFQRFGHWLLALSFIILALTGLNALYGREVLLGILTVPWTTWTIGPVLSPAAFAAMTSFGKWLHTYVAFAFMLALAITFLAWLRHSFPHWRDLVWVLRGGGLFVRGSHPPAWKFNAGQKIMFWAVMLGGLALSLTGLALMLPVQPGLFAKTIALINMAGFKLPTELTPAQETQLAAAWHGIIALGLIVIVIAHIYMRTLGMQGAFSAMGSGQVDVGWAKQHHSLWAERELKKMEEAATATTRAARMAPAE